jgi:hypothetical protein
MQNRLAVEWAHSRMKNELDHNALGRQKGLATLPIQGLRLNSFAVLRFASKSRRLLNALFSSTSCVKTNACLRRKLPFSIRLI